MGAFSVFDETTVSVSGSEEPMSRISLKAVEHIECLSSYPLPMSPLCPYGAQEIRIDIWASGKHYRHGMCSSSLDVLVIST